jgi:hypothetical protein
MHTICFTSVFVHNSAVVSKCRDCTTAKRPRHTAERASTGFVAVARREQSQLAFCPSLQPYSCSHCLPDYQAHVDPQLKPEELSHGYAPVPIPNQYNAGAFQRQVFVEVGG